MCACAMYIGIWCLSYGIIHLIPIPNPFHVRTYIEQNGRVKRYGFMSPSHIELINLLLFIRGTHYRHHHVMFVHLTLIQTSKTKEHSIMS
jgi:hypothetical protein